MSKWRLNGCPRCGGDLFAGRDEYNAWYESCLQCGYMAEMKTVGAVKQETRKVEEKPVEAG